MTWREKILFIVIRKAAERENKTLARIRFLILAGLAIIIYFMIAIILKKVL